MGLQHPDIVELLYPQGSQREWARARRWVTHLRLLESDGAASSVPSVGVSRSLAQGELEWVLRRRLLQSTQALLQHSLGSLIVEDSHVGFGRPLIPYQEAWSQLEVFRLSGWNVPDIPTPGESVLEVAGRILEKADRLELPKDRVQLWRSRLERLQGEPVSQPTWESEQGSATMEFAADEAGTLLDRGRPREALEHLESLEDRTVALTGRARLLREWSQTVLDGGSAAVRTAAGEQGSLSLPPASSQRDRRLGIEEGLPATLLQLRDAWPETLPNLRGSGPVGRAPIPTCSRLPSRADLGAVVLIHVDFDGATARLADVQVPPGIRPSVGDWHLDRDRAWLDHEAPEHELLLTGRAVLRRSRPDQPAPQGSLDPNSRALALVPIPSTAGKLECTGWVQIEYLHALLPARERMESWGRQLCADRGPVSVPAPLGRVQPIEPLAQDLAPHRDAARLLAELLADVGTQLGRRRWWGFLVGSAGLMPVGSGGQGLQDSEAGAGRGVQRALRTGGVARFNEPDSEIALARSAGSGVVIPARLRGRVVALLAMESDRRRAFREGDVTRVEQALQERSLALRLAAFRAWHMNAYNSDLAFAAGVPGFDQLAHRLRSAAEAQTPVLITGCPGTGKHILMRWMQFEWALGHAPDIGSRVFSAQVPLGSVQPPSAVEITSAFEQPLAFFERPESWPSERQRQLAEALDHSPRTKVFVHLQGRVEAAEQGCTLDARLVRTLSSLEVRVSNWADRRGELPQLVNGLLRILREDHGGPLLRLEDSAMALFWRQPWGAGLADLKGSLLKLHLDAPGEGVGLGLAHDILSAYGRSPLKRLSSRRPRRLDVEAALETTRLESGRINKTRAALYLGWDPDTLVARMQDLGIGMDGAPIS